MRSLYLSLAAVVVASTSALAQVHVIPNGLAATAGNSSNAFPWGTSASTFPGLRHMSVYDSSNFTAASIPGPLLISRLRWRANDSTSTWTGGTFTTGTVRLSTAAVDWAAVTTNFAGNHGPDLITAYTGPVVYLPGTGLGVGVPGPYVVDITLTTPFFYDPAVGDLVIDCDYPGGTNFVGGTLSSMDVQTTNSNASRIYASSLYPAANGMDLNHGVVVEVTYTVSPGAATGRPYGTGCYDIPRSFYELFPTAAAFDLANSSLTMVFNGSDRYQVVAGTSSYVAPTAAATIVANGDDLETVVTLGSSLNTPSGSTTGLAVCSNGFVSAATGNGTGFAPAVGGFLGFPRTVWALAWHDFNPAATNSGKVKFEEIGNISYVTWEGVYDFGGTTAANASTMQLQFDRSNGNVHMIWGTMSTIGGNGFLVGFKAAGGPALDPGNRDISATLAAGFVAGIDTRALHLTGFPRPVLGRTVTLTSTNIPAGAAIGATVLSFTKHDPGIDLTSLGMPGCQQYVNLDSTQLFFPSGGTGSTTLFIPNNPIYTGMHVYAQSAAFAPGVNPLGVLSSNGWDMQVGVL